MRASSGLMLEDARFYGFSSDDFGLADPIQNLRLPRTLASAFASWLLTISQDNKIADVRIPSSVESFIVVLVSNRYD